jgi:hypothetical protein
MGGESPDKDGDGKPDPQPAPGTGRGNRPRAGAGTIKEEFYAKLKSVIGGKKKLFCEEQTEPRGAQVNQAAYGFTPRGGRNVRKALSSLQSGMWRGDSTFSGPIQPTGGRLSPIDSKFQKSIGERLSPHVITLMGAAQEHGIEMTKEEAVNPSSENHKRLLAKYPQGHDVHTASKSVAEIMSSARG